MIDHKQIYSQAANGNASAFLFLMGFNNYVHKIDDVQDSEQKDYKLFIRTLAFANELFTCDFYQANIPKLQPIVRLVTSHYADAARMEKSSVEWERKWADTLRFCGNLMVEAVAEITGGYDLVRQVGPLLRENSWHSHHMADGTPV